MNRNLDQIRADGALKAAGKFAPADIAKLPPLILSNGLLATIAFAIEPKAQGGLKRPEFARAMDRVAGHLADPLIGRLNTENSTASLMLSELVSKESDSQRLIAATAEALAFLGYLKRFACKTTGTTSNT